MTEKTEKFDLSSTIRDGGELESIETRLKSLSLREARTTVALREGRITQETAWQIYARVEKKKRLIRAEPAYERWFNAYLRAAEQTLSE